MMPQSHKVSENVPVIKDSGFTLGEQHKLTLSIAGGCSRMIG